MEAKMRPGPGAFAIAEFDGEAPFESEIPNIVLLPVVVPDRPAGASARKMQKKPAAAESDVLPPARNDMYKLELYKSRHKIGLRRTTGDKRQFYQFGSMTYAFDDLIVVGNGMIKSLAEGSLLEENVAARVAVRLAKMSV